MKGIVLAGGSGTRLHPLTLAVSKQVLPVYDKPMIYYPLSVLMLAGIREVLVISTPTDLPVFQRLLGSGEQWGLSLSYTEQAAPNGLPEAFLLGRDFVGDDSVCLVLGDNIFYGHGFGDLLHREVSRLDGCALFAYPVRDPQRYGVPVFDASGTLVGIEEKPAKPASNLAVTGLYLYDNAVLDYATELQPSARGELEIADLNNRYIEQRRARLVDLGRGMAWLDTGTHDSLLEAGQFVQVLEHRQGVRIACLEELALRNGWIDREQVRKLGESMGKSSYAEYVRALAAE